MSVKPPSQVPAPAKGNYSYGPLVNITDGWIEALDIVVMVLRLVTRLNLTESRLWWDDYFILAALVATLWQLAGNGIEVHYGFGRSEHYLTDHELKWFLAYSYGEWIQTFFTLTCTKVSMCFFLLRLPASRNLIRPLQAAIIFLLGSGMLLIVIWALQCHPLETAWDLNVPGMCFPKSGLIGIIMAQAVISIVSDFGLSLYPILILRNLHTSRRNKIGLCVLMGLGVITGVCAIVRTVLYEQWIPDDVTYGGITNWFWRTFEVNLGMVCVCIPTLVPGYKWVRRRLRQRAQHHLPDKVAPNGPTPEKDRQEVKDIKYPEPSTTRNASRNERALMGRFMQDLESQTPTNKVEVDEAPDLPRGQQRVAVVMDQQDVHHTLKKSKQEGLTPSQSSTWFSDQRDSSTLEQSRDNSASSNSSQGTGRSDQPLVGRARDPEKALDVDVQPSFRENRSLWRRMLHRVNESSPGTWLNSTARMDSTVASQGTQR